MLRIAIQSHGRLNQEALELLDSVGVKLTIRETLPVLVKSNNFPAEVLFFEKDRIPEFVETGVADIGIVGEYLAVSKNIPEECIIKKLEFDNCNLSLAIPRDVKYKGVEWFIGKRVATPYPDALQKYFKSKNIRAKIIEAKENVSMALQVDLADAVFDRVFSGTTLFNQHLKVVENVMHSQAVIIVNPKLSTPNQMILDEFMMRIDSVKSAFGKKYMTLNVPTAKLDELLKILPSAKKPTVLSLADADWNAVHTLIDEKRFWDIIDRLKEIGAENIALLPISNLIE